MGESSIAEMNSSYLAERATSLNSAISAALASKDAPAPKASKHPAVAAGTAKPSDTSAPVVAASEPLSSSTSTEAETAETAVSEALEADPSAETEPEAEEPASADLGELQALGKKRDLRALEKKLGLPDGHLGARNGEFAALRRRQDEVAASEEKLIAKFGPPVELIQHARKGDLRAYANLIAQTTGVTVEQFIGYWSKNVQSIETTGHTVQEPPPKQLPPAEDPAAKTQAATAKADAFIKAEAGNHPAFKLEGAAEGVRKLWLQSYDAKSKSFKLSPQAAAGEFVKQRRAAYEREQWILSGKTPPKPARTKTQSRTAAAESQPRNETLTREQLIERGAAEIRRQKARDAAAGR